MYLVGVPDAPVSNVKLTDAPTQKFPQAVPRSPSSDVTTAAPASNVSAANPESGLPKTPAKGMAYCHAQYISTVEIVFAILSK